ncbi:MAG: hypothetical protein ACD_79C00487G0003 [uncultured bacterium]|nr:MAG: hypothetical protein ACD_79C00487G0003 [uncultured bacterium]
MKFNIWKLFLIVFVFFPLLYAQESDFKPFTSTDGKIKLTVPNNWAEMQLNESAEVQLGFGAEEQYLIVLSENKEDMYGWNIQKHSLVTLGNLVSSLDDPIIKAPVELTIDNSKAIQYEIEGSSQGLRIVYIHTTVENENSFNQVLAWSIKSKYSSNKALLQNVVNSFQKIS